MTTYDNYDNMKYVFLLLNQYDSGIVKATSTTDIQMIAIILPQINV